MYRLMIAAVLLAAAGPAGAETVVATRAMNPRLDGFTPGITPAGRRGPNTGIAPTCSVVTANFQYPDGSVRRESKQRCE